MFNRKEYRRRWYIKNRERLLKKKRNDYKDNREKVLKQNNQWKKNNPEYMKQYYTDNKERLGEQRKQYHQTEKGKAAKQRARTERRTKIRMIINTLTAKEWLDILEKHDYRCIYCGKKLIDSFDTTRDHVIPISKGGYNTKENVVPACRCCNSKKGNKIKC